MRILLIGNSGQLGREFNRTLPPLGEIISTDYPNIDLAAQKSVIQCVHDSHPNLIVNTAAFTDVDGAENNKDLAMAVNGTGVGWLVEEAKKINAVLIHFSTDYVFNGVKGSLYREEDQPNPINTYGRSKLAGEQAVLQSGCDHLIFRTSWVYTLNGGFVGKLLKWAFRNRTLTIVDDQIANPTWARALAETVTALVSHHKDSLSSFAREYTGLYHLAGAGYCSRLEWARAALDAAGRKEVELLAGKTSDFSTPAARPLFSALDCAKFENTFRLSLPDWRQALNRAFSSPG